MHTGEARCIGCAWGMKEIREVVKMQSFKIYNVRYILEMHAFGDWEAMGKTLRQGYF